MSNIAVPDISPMDLNAVVEGATILAADFVGIGTGVPLVLPRETHYTTLHLLKEASLVLPGELLEGVTALEGGGHT